MTAPIAAVLHNRLCFTCGRMRMEWSPFAVECRRHGLQRLKTYWDDRYERYRAMTEESERREMEKVRR